MALRPALVFTLMFGAGAAYGEDLPPDPGGEICTRPVALGETLGEEHGNAPVGDNAGIGCSLAPVIDPASPAWASYDVTNLPRQLAVRVAVDLSFAKIAVKEEIDVLDVRAQTMYSSPITVSLGGGPPGYVRLSWLEDGTHPKSRTHPLPSSTPTLGLWLDRGRADDASSGFVKLQVDGEDVLETGSGDSAAAALPAPGSSTPARIRFGVIGVRELDPYPTASEGVLFIRPVSVELVWPKQPSAP